MKKNTKTILIIAVIAVVVAVAGILAVRGNKPAAVPTETPGNTTPECVNKTL